MNRKDTALGICAALTANIIFGFSFMFSKIALQYARPLTILAVRFTVAFIIMTLLWAFGIIKLNFKGKSIKKLVIMAVMQPLLYFIFELYGIDNTSSAISGIIISLVPVGVIIISLLFLSEKPTKLQIISSAVSLAAVILISIYGNNGGKNNIIGVVLLLLAVVCAAVFNILSRSEADKFTPFERTYMMFLVGSVGFNIIAAISLGKTYLSDISTNIVIPEFDFAIIYLAVISSILAFMLYNFATSKIDAVRAASFSNIITVVSVFAGIVILNEQLSVFQIICCLLIIAGVYGVNK